MRMNSKLVKDWVGENNPNGIAKLSIASGLSVETLKRVHAGLYEVKNEYRIKKLATALGCTVEDLLKQDEEAS